jgi:hypothetical protein
LQLLDSANIKQKKRFVLASRLSHLPRGFFPERLALTIPCMLCSSLSRKEGEEEQEQLEDEEERRGRRTKKKALTKRIHELIFCQFPII